MRVGSAGTHPFSLFERQRITARDRYRNLVDQLQYIARRELIFGMHVHVAVDDPEKAIQVVNGLLPQLGPLLALSASSPFWRGEPTGLSSSRQMVFAAFPRSGPPPRFPDYADYAEVVGQLERTGLHRGLHAHLVGHPPPPAARNGRDPDLRRGHAASRTRPRSPPTARRSSSRSASGSTAARQIPCYHRILTTENKWLAARYGLEAPVMDLGTGLATACRSRSSIRRTLKEIEPHARELGSERELEGIGEILGRGNGSDRQLRVFNANRDIVEVVEEIAKATEAVPPSPPARRVWRNVAHRRSMLVPRRTRSADSRSSAREDAASGRAARPGVAMFRTLRASRRRHLEVPCRRLECRGPSCPASSHRRAGRGVERESAVRAQGVDAEVTGGEAEAGDRSTRPVRAAHDPIRRVVGPEISTRTEVERAPVPRDRPGKRTGAAQLPGHGETRRANRPSSSRGRSRRPRRAPRWSRRDGGRPGRASTRSA